MRPSGLTAWKRLSAKDQRAAIAGIAPYREDCRKRGIAMMYGQGYLNHRRWEDEFEDAAAPPPAPSAVQLSVFDDMTTW